MSATRGSCRRRQARHDELDAGTLQWADDSASIHGRGRCVARDVWLHACVPREADAELLVEPRGFEMGLSPRVSRGTSSFIPSSSTAGRAAVWLPAHPPCARCRSCRCAPARGGTADSAGTPLHRMPGLTQRAARAGDAARRGFARRHWHSWA